MGERIQASRRRFLVTGGLTLLGGGCGGSEPEAIPATPAQAWQRLLEGNRRWAAGRAEHPRQEASRRRQLARGQTPFAVILSCIDSRVPPETIFDQGLGDLMIIRTAGHTVDPLVTAAVEYGPHELRVPLVVVLGHERCGAVTAAVHALRTGKKLPGLLPKIVEAVAPAVKSAAATGDPVESAIRAHVARTAAAIAADSLLAPHLDDGRLGVVGAYYALESGRVSTIRAPTSP